MGVGFPVGQSDSAEDINLSAHGVLLQYHSLHDVTQFRGRTRSALGDGLLSGFEGFLLQPGMFPVAMVRLSPGFVCRL